MSEGIKIKLPLAKILLVLFIMLKLCKVIDWSWWWVLSPLWIAIGIWLVMLLLVGLGFLFALFISKDEWTFKRKIKEN